LFAQEHDDLYFRAKDRQKATAGKQAYASNYEQFKKQHFPEAAQESTNPTDSYSARQINPEYLSRSQADVAGAADENYFDNQYSPASQAVAFNNAYYFNNNLWNRQWGTGWFNGGWARPWNNPWYWGYYDPFMNPWMSSWMNPWMDPWMSPFTLGWNYGFNSMWAPGFTGWGLSVGYGWGNTWGWNNWASPYWNTWGMWRNPGFIIIQPNEVNRNYGKRYSQTNAVAGDVRRHYNNSPRQANPNGTVNGSSVNSGTTSGRMRGGDDYYVPPSRRAAPSRQQSTSPRDNTSPSFNTRPAAPSRNWQGSGSNTNGFNDSRPSYSSPSHSRPSYSSPSRSGGSFGSPGGGVRPSAPSGGRSRGGH
jgi:hypothetical protein